MLVPDTHLQYWLDNFQGYGSFQAKVWFVAHEEEGGNLPEEVAAKLSYFYRIHAGDNENKLCNIRDLYREVPYYSDGPRAEKFDNHFDYRFGKNAVLHGLWKNLTAFVYGFNNKKLPDLLKYQKTELCAPDKHDMAMLRLYPLPSPHNHGWYYSWLELPAQFGFLKSRALYEEHVYGSRMEKILGTIRQHRPGIVVMYGMSNINSIKQSVAEAFPDVKFRTTKATKLVIPQYHRADLEGTILMITTQVPALRHGRVESGFDWYKLGQTLNSEL